MRLLRLFTFFLMMTLLAAAPATAQGDGDALTLLINFALQQPSIAGPLRGELPIGLGASHLQAARVEVRDFYARATFSNPDSTREQPWDMGISFRQTGIDGGLKLIIESDGTWSFKAGMQPIVASGPVQNLGTGPGTTTYIDLVALGSEGYFAVNGEYVATLDLSAREATGDIAVGAAYFAQDRRKRERIAYEGFEVWSLDRTSSAPGIEPNAEMLRALMAEATATAGDAGPFSGDLLLEEDTLNFSAANVFLRDFYAHAVFTNPYSASEFPWDIGVGFRDRGGTDVRLVVNSDGEWFLSQSTEPFRASGQGAQINPGASDRNELDLVVSGDTGYFAVNGEYVATLDLSVNDGRGDVWIGSGFFAESTRAGATTGYTDFRVWSLDAPAPAGDAAGLVVWGDGEVIFGLPARGGSGITALASVVANGDETIVEVRLAGTTEDHALDVVAGTCDDLEPIPSYELEPVDRQTMTSVTTVGADFEELTSGGYAIAVRGGTEAAEAVRACNEIPARDAEASE